MSHFLAPPGIERNGGGQTFSAILPEQRTALKGLNKQPFRTHMAFLADDLLERRGTGTRGHELAARYTAAQFESMGLVPAGQLQVSAACAIRVRTVSGADEL